MTDPLSEIMKRVQLEACVYFEREFHAPFAMEMGTRAFAQFHAVTGGSCILEYQGESREVRTGEVLLFPRGAAHVLTDKPGQHPVSGEAFMKSLADPTPLFSTDLHPAQIVCGHFAYRRAGHHRSRNLVLQPRKGVRTTASRPPNSSMVWFTTGAPRTPTSTASASA